MNEDVKVGRVERVLEYIDFLAKLLPVMLLAGVVMAAGGAEFWHTDIGMVVWSGAWMMTHPFG